MRSGERHPSDGGGAQSPRETLLRLYVRDVLPDGLEWQSQVKVEYLDGGGKPRTTWFDLACEDIAVGLYYDGRLHGEAARKTKDFRQLQDLKDREWEVVRVDRDLMADASAMREQVRNAVARGMRTVGG